MIKSSLSDFDTYFIGSSLGLKHINPSVVDSVTGGTTNSLNLSIAGCTMPESFNAFYQLLDKIETTDEPKNIVFELQSIREIPEYNIGTTRTTQMVNFSNLMVSSKYLWHKRRIADLKIYFQSFLFNFFGSNLFHDIFSFKASGKDKETTPARKKILLRNQGFIPNKVPKKKVKYTKWDTLRFDYQDNKLDKGELSVLKKLNNMVKDAKKKNVNVFYYFAIGISELEDLKLGIEEEQLLDLTEYYPEMYEDLSIWKNPTHLNVLGAEKFSTILGESLLSKI